MRSLYILFFLALALGHRAQIFQGTGGSIVNGGSETVYTLSVSGLPSQLDSTFGLEKICFDLNHPAVEELHVYLRSPSGTQVELTGMKSCKGANFSSTCLDNFQA